MTSESDTSFGSIITTIAPVNITSSMLVPSMATNSSGSTDVEVHSISQRNVSVSTQHAHAALQNKTALEHQDGLNRRLNKSRASVTSKSQPMANTSVIALRHGEGNKTGQFLGLSNATLLQRTAYNMSGSTLSSSNVQAILNAKNNSLVGNMPGFPMSAIRDDNPLLLVINEMLRNFLKGLTENAGLAARARNLTQGKMASKKMLMMNESVSTANFGTHVVRNSLRNRRFLRAELYCFCLLKMSPSKMIIIMHG